jgi:hypothetical protein
MPLLKFFMSPESRRWLSCIFAAALGLLSLYMAMAGWVVAEFDTATAEAGASNSHGEKEYFYHGHSFANRAEALAFIDDQKVAEFFGWVYSVPESLPLLIASFFFGVLGGITSVLFAASGSEPISNRFIVFKPLFGGTIGLLVLGVVKIVPAALTKEANATRPIAVVFLCLFAGAFSDHVHLWVKQNVEEIFKIKK